MEGGGGGRRILLTESLPIFSGQGTEFVPIEIIR